MCVGCPPHEVGCGILELTSTQGPTTIPTGDACKAICTFGDQPATCTARIEWSKEHIFEGKPHACKQAHDMVLGQCEVCRHCTLQAATCTGEEGPEDANAEEQLFDCYQGAAVEWGTAKVLWCCEHHERGCDAVPRNRPVFFQKKISDDVAEADQQLARRGQVFRYGFIALCGVGSFALLFARSWSSVSRQRRYAYTDFRNADRLIFVE